MPSLLLPVHYSLPNHPGDQLADDQARHQNPCQPEHVPPDQVELSDDADARREEDHREEFQEQVGAPFHGPFRHCTGKQKPDQHQQREEAGWNGNSGPRHQPLASGVERPEDDELQASPEQEHARWPLYPSSTTFSPNSRSTAAISASETSTLRPVPPMSASASPGRTMDTASGVAPACSFASPDNRFSRSSVTRSARTRSSRRFTRLSRTSLSDCTCSTMSSAMGFSSSRVFTCTVPVTRMGSSDLRSASQDSYPGRGPDLVHLPSLPITERPPSLPGKHTSSTEPLRSSSVTQAMRLPVLVGRSRSWDTMPATVTTSSRRARWTDAAGRAYRWSSFAYWCRGWPET